MRKILATTGAAITIVIGTLALTASPAMAGPYRAGCSAWIISTGRPGGGFAATCTGGPTSVQYRVAGLCQNLITLSSRWVEGPWKTSGVSDAYCSMWEIPRTTYYQTK